MFRTRTKEATPAQDSAPEVYPEDTGYGSHALHTTDASCARCNHALKDSDEVRRRADGTYVHLCC